MEAYANIPTRTADFWQATLTDPVLLWCGGVIVVLVIIIALLLRALIRIASTDKAAVTLWRDTNGTAMAELTLLLPIMLFVILALAQAMLFAGGNLFVHYAAFAAARSAVVQVPTDYTDSEANTYTDASGTSKRELIWRSAVFAVVPACGRDDGTESSIPTAAYIQGLNDFYNGYNLASPPWIERLIADRLRYAAKNTEITLLRPYITEDSQVAWEEISDGQFDPKDPITVRVDHRLDLPIPYVNRIIDDGKQPDGKGRYIMISATATLINQGILDRLPPEPGLPRLD